MVGSQEMLRLMPCQASPFPMDIKFDNSVLFDPSCQSQHQENIKHSWGLPKSLCWRPHEYDFSNNILNAINDGRYMNITSDTDLHALFHGMEYLIIPMKSS